MIVTLFRPAILLHGQVNPTSESIDWFLYDMRATLALNGLIKLMKNSKIRKNISKTLHHSTALTYFSLQRSWGIFPAEHFSMTLVLLISASSKLDIAVTLTM